MKQLTIVMVVAALLLATPAIADWDEGDGHKMHHPQTPKPGGLDIAFGDSSLADDWMCSWSGPVNDIHFWISWHNNMVWSINQFQVRIWSDNPSGPHGYSQPETLLWERNFTDVEFVVRDMQPDGQGWYDPESGQFNPGFDHDAWQQINIAEIVDPFIQEEGTIYWLEIDFLNLVDNVGWKETDRNFNDDAVRWGWDPGLQESRWFELRNPGTQQSIDLAFVITPEPATMTLIALGGLALLRRRRK